MPPKKPAEAPGKKPEKVLITSLSNVKSVGGSFWSDPQEWMLI